MSNVFKVVIGTLNSKYIHSSLAPWCLFAAAREYCKDGICANVVEGTINENISDITERIAVQTPDAVALGCYIWNITKIYELIKMLKEKLPNVIIILGGPEVSYNAEHVLRNQPLVDYIISGEGEYPLSMLLNKLFLNETDIESIKGICFRKTTYIDTKYIISEPYVSDKSYPSPYVPEYFEALHGRIAYIESSRGCPYSCAFCLSGRTKQHNGQSVKYFDMERIEKEIIMLSGSGAKTVKFVDRTFNANPKRAYHIFKFIIENYRVKIPEGVCFHFEIAGDILTDYMINLLSTAPAGLIQFEIGLQSFNSHTLESIHRRTDVKKLKENIARIIENGNIHVHVDLIAGLPFENYESFAESFNTAYLLNAHMLQMGFLKLLYGAPMRENRSEYPCEFSETPPYEVISTPWLTENDLKKLHIVESALDRIYNSGRFRRTIEYIINSCSMTPFEIFYRIGKYTSENVPSEQISNISLDEYTKILYECLCGFGKTDSMTLRDMMVCDRLSTNSTGFIPPILRIFDPDIKKIKTEIESNPAICEKKGIRRGFALLYSEKCAVYADYDENIKNPVTGEYPLYKFYPQKI